MEPILDDFKRAQIVSILAVGGSRVLAAKFVGCHPRTIYNTAKANPDFAKRLNLAESSPEYQLLSSVTEAGKKGVVHAAKWALERIYFSRYRPRTPGGFSQETVKQLLEELITRLADSAPGDEERCRIFETGAAFAKELLGEPLDPCEQLRNLTEESSVLADLPIGEQQADIAPPPESPTNNTFETQTIPTTNPAQDPQAERENRHVA